MPQSFTELIRKLSEHLRGASSSAITDLFGSSSSTWLVAIGIFLLLPIVGLFTRPFVRLAAIVTTSLASVASAVVVCLSAWGVLILQYAAAFARIISPRAIFPAGITQARPALLFPFMAIALVAILIALTNVVRTKRDLHHCLINGVIVQSCVSGLGAKPL